jgi:hypothetical protein
MFEMFWIQARFHKFGSKASTNAGILLHSVHQKTVFHVRGEHSIFLLGTRERKRPLAIAFIRSSNASPAGYSSPSTESTPELWPSRKWHRHSCLCVFLGASRPSVPRSSKPITHTQNGAEEGHHDHRLVSTPRDRLQYKNPFDEGALLCPQRIQIPAPCKPLAA